MDARPATCPTADTLRAYGVGKLDKATTAMVAQHLEACPDCRRLVGGLSPASFVGGHCDAQGGTGTSAPDQALAGVSPPPKAACPAPPTTAVPPELAHHPQYEVVRELGRGGMGVVYLARNRDMDRLEVLKVVNQALLDRPGALERFQQEIRAAARLSHPNIVAAYSVLRPGALLVFAMEYVDGKDLAAVVKRNGPLPVPNACFYAQQAALGLQHAFEKGMVHRDIKPHNLILALEGKKHIVKVLDFGLAKATREKGLDRGLTGHGQLLGTPEYIAPEQTLDAAQADIRADIYSLGCTLYYLLTGGPPFSARSLYEILQAHQAAEARPLNRVRPEVPVELAAVVAKMMAKDPAQRDQKPVEVTQALAPFLKPRAKAAPSNAALAQSFPVVRPTAVKEEAKVRPGSPPGAAGVAGEAPVELPAVESMPVRWDTLAEVGSTSLDPRQGVTVRKARAGKTAAPKKWPIGAAVATGVLLALLGLWAGGVFKVKTAYGTLVLENLPADAEVAVDGAQVTFKATDGKTVEISVVAGTKHQLQVKQEGFAVFVEQEVQIDAGGRRRITVRLDRLPLAAVGPEPVKPVPPPAAKANEEAITTASGLKYINRKEGTGPEARKGDTVEVHYTGWLQDGTKFDSSQDRGQPFPFILGAGKVIKGWDEGVAGMKVGGLRKLIIPPDLAYGKRGVPPAIPPDAELTFAVELLTIREEPAKSALAPGLAAADQGFVPLFNGRDLTGWKTHLRRPGNWRVEHEVLIGSGPGTNHLYSQGGAYDDFHLRVEARINDGGHGGVFFRAPFGPVVPPNDPTLPAGFMAVIDSTFPQNPLKTGSLYARGSGNLVIVPKSPVPPGEWFTLEVLAVGNHVVVKVNGTTMGDYTDPKRDYTIGHLVLEQLTPETVIEFRKIEIKELPASTPRPTAGSVNTAAHPKRREDGFMPLFNGKDLTGWQGAVSFGNRLKLSADELAAAQNAQNKEVLPHWSVEDGILVNDGRGDNLATVQDYGDIELYVDWKIEPKGDSGIYLRGQPQVQIWDSDSLDPTRFTKDVGKGSGALWNNRTNNVPLKKADRAPGEWNTFHLVMKDDKVTVKLNGALVVDQVALENYFERGKPLPAKGPIELQRHSKQDGTPGRLWFRNIYIKELPASAPRPTASGANTAALPKEKADSFVPLFNGKDLTGWKTHPKQRGNWRVENGILIGSGPAASYLYTQRGDYRNFDLRVEARINDGGNSGVFLRTPFGPVWPTRNPAWPSGYEVQINSTHADAKRTGSLIVNNGAGSPPGVIVREALLPPGKWFTLEVSGEGNHFVIKVDGKTTADYLDEKRIFASGHITLQQWDRQTLCEFRKIEIKNR